MPASGARTAGPSALGLPRPPLPAPCLARWPHAPTPYSLRNRVSEVDAGVESADSAAISAARRACAISRFFRSVTLACRDGGGGAKRAKKNERIKRRNKKCKGKTEDKNDENNREKRKEKDKQAKPARRAEKTETQKQNPTKTCEKRQETETITKKTGLENMTKTRKNEQTH